MASAAGELAPSYSVIADPAAIKTMPPS